MTRLDLPDEVHQALDRAARESGLTVAEWIAARLTAETNGQNAPSEQDIRAADGRLEACITDYGYAIGADNESIDEDLALAYADPHLQDKAA